MIVANEVVDVVRHIDNRTNSCNLIYIFEFTAEIDEYYADVRYERIAILNALGAYYSYLGKIETKQREKEEYFIQATKYYNKASRIDMHEPSTWVGKGAVEKYLLSNMTE